MGFLVYFSKQMEISVFIRITTKKMHEKRVLKFIILNIYRVKDKIEPLTENQIL